MSQKPTGGVDAGRIKVGWRSSRPGVGGRSKIKNKALLQDPTIGCDTIAVLTEAGKKNEAVGEKLPSLLWEKKKKEY